MDSTARAEHLYQHINQPNQGRMPSTFYDSMATFPWAEWEERIDHATPTQVEMALHHAGHCSPEEFAALISPAAQKYIEPMAQLSHKLTLQRFGRVISMYVPLYLSNSCTNACLYCGFNHKNKILRRTLTMAEITEEAEAIKALGYEHILLLTGEDPVTSGFDYLREAIRTVRPYFSQISIEVQPLDIAQYEALTEEGLYGVYIYQETYNPDRYPLYHVAGRKSSYRYRLETPDRIGTAGVRKAGIGALLGLENWRVESLCTALHLRHLQKRYWKTRYSISFPRLRPHAGAFEPQYHVTDRDMLQIICAYRLFDRDIEMSMTTRESPRFRDNAFPLGITALSAGSHTEPGGYAHPNKDLEQFVISDDRSPQEIVKLLTSHGYEAVWKDWDPVLQ